MGATHFRMRRLMHVRTEMAFQVLAYNIKRMIALIGVRGLLAAIPAGDGALSSDRSPKAEQEPCSRVSPIRGAQTRCRNRGTPKKPAGHCQREK